MAGYRIKWSSEAKSDLQKTLVYYNNRNKSNIYSKKLLVQIARVEGFISENPRIGLASIHKNVRIFIFSNFEIIYRIESSRDIVVVMFWDCRRNPEDKTAGKRITSNY